MGELLRLGATWRPRRSLDVARASAAAVTVLELEQVVQRLAHLVLHADALAERMVASAGGSALDCADRAERVRRLRAAVELGQRATQAAVCYAAPLPSG